MINDFFIHDLSNDMVNLKLPLPPHRKTVHDFVLITKGKMIRRLDIDLYEIGPNSVFYTSAGSITTTEYISKDIEGYFCHFSDDFLALNTKSYENASQPVFICDTHDPKHSIPSGSINPILLLVNRMVELYKFSNHQNLLHKYLITLLAEFKIFSLSSSEVRDSLIHRFKKSVKLNFKSIHSISSYADLLHVSPNHLNKYVKLKTGKTASHFLKEHLLLEAKVLLYQSNLTIKEISNELGFNDLSYFGRFFKNNTGYTPSEFRKMID